MTEKYKVAWRYAFSSAKNNTSFVDLRKILILPLEK